MPDNGLSIVILFVCAVATLISLYYLIIAIKEIFRKKRKFKGNGFKGVFALLVSFIIMGGFAYCLYNAPFIIYNGYTWTMIEEWGPSALIHAVLSLVVLLPVFYLYFMTSYFFVKPDDKPFFMIIILSIISGIGNSLIVFIINQALNRTLNAESRYSAVESGLYFYFLLGILLFTVSAYIVRKRLIVITSNVVFDKRMEIIRKVLMAPFNKFESIDDEKTYAALNNDTEAVSGFVNMFVNGLTGIITMITCFIYLGTLHLSGMFFTLLIILLAVVLFLNVSRSAEKAFEKNRDIQNLFFKNITDLVRGFKELSFNRKKKKEFGADIEKNCEMYRDTRVEGEFKFVGVSILGEVMYLFVLGLIVFTFPYLFRNIQDSTLSNYVLVCLYMGGIVNQEIYLVPGVMRIMVSWKRIKGYISGLSMIGAEEKKLCGLDDTGGLTIGLKKVKYQYKNDAGEKFTVGPIDFSFKSGESVFITGGNGSGKSTLAKLITGLYPPDEGEITVNGRNVEMESLGNCFSTVFSDFYLFDKLYGIDYQEKEKDIQKYLDILRIRDKLQIDGGKFSTLKLSTGQRKRLALMISYLEDRPAYLFDEWAADQDPEFRSFFYKTIIPYLKAKEKVVIAITHDDRYFDEADKLIKMETGRIVWSKGIDAMDDMGIVSA